MARFSRPLTHHCVLPSKWWRVPESNWSGRGMNPASSPNDPQRWEGKPESNRTGNSFKGCWRHQPPASPQYREWDSNPHCTHFECAASCHWATSAKSAREVNRIAYLQQMGLARISSQIKHLHPAIGCLRTNLHLPVSNFLTESAWKRLLASCPITPAIKPGRGFSSIT